MPRRRRSSYHPLGAATDLSEASAAERALLRRALVRSVSRLPQRALRLVAPTVLEFVRDQAGWLDVDLGSHDFDVLDHQRDPVGDLSRPVLEEVCAALADTPAPPRAVALDRRMDWLATTLALDAVDRALLGLFARHARFEAWRALVRALPGGGRGLSPGVLSLLSDHTARAIDARVSPGSRLVASGLVTCDSDGDLDAGRFLVRVAGMHTSAPEALARRMLPPAPASTLGWEDFSHVAARDLAANAIAAAARENRGVNVLLHGVAGTGKSELARAIADRTGLVAVFAGLADDDGGEPTRRERLAHLNVLRGLTRTSRRHVIVVDEAEDVLNLIPTDGREGRSKLWLNRLVEEVRVPTIWIANNLDQLEETVVRRMHLAVSFTLPPEPVRARVVTRAAAARRMALSEGEIAAVAQLPAAPAVLTSAVEAARLSGGGGEAARRIGEGLLEALGHPPLRVVPRPAIYDPSLAQADQDLAQIAARLAATPSRGWSLLLAGPPGTGKSAYARHLAHMLGIEVQEQRGSDLLSPYVGGTEANIARAFRDTAERGAMLLIDEADTFLFDRRTATRSWEGSMVNEMLRWMEHHPAPFVATTNLADTLDPATQRRFTLTVRFRTLTPARAAALFAATFGLALPAGAPPLEGVTPGDVGVVAKRAGVLGERDPTTLAAWIRAEAEARGAGGARTGFHLPAREPVPLPHDPA
ncbi:AAA family ATPase [Sphingomonas corticis]|uniref:AAA family ATPase n=1 Tax=Sphingomonas corticis TaxID=2722791 RepID=A0ABX1CQY9_9SPHN|nr:AAA family ATPase [Sphingomonas corticis]NJR80368.1 AAA family ATPase [Sphingomonas corticis]